MTKFGTKLPETGIHLQVICLHDDLCPLGASTDPNQPLPHPLISFHYGFGVLTTAETRFLPAWSLERRAFSTGF